MSMTADVATSGTGTMRRRIADGWAGVLLTVVGLGLAPFITETAAWRNDGWVLLAVPTLVGVAGWLSSAAASRRVRSTLGDAVVVERDGVECRRQVHMAYALTTGLLALTAMTVGGVDGPRITGDGAQLLWIGVAVLLLSPAGVWTVILDGATVTLGLLRIGSVLVAAVPVCVVGLFAGYLGFIVGAGLLGIVSDTGGPDVVAWMVASASGITLGYALAILPLYLLGPFDRR